MKTRLLSGGTWICGETIVPEGLRVFNFHFSLQYGRNGYVRANGGRFVDIYDGRIESIPEEYRIKGPNLYMRAAVGRTEEDMER